MKAIMKIHGPVLIMVALCLLVFGTAVQAQNDGGQGDLDRDRDQDRTQQFSKDQVRNNLHDNVNAAAGLSDGERKQMHANVDACVDLDISQAGLEALFPGEQKQARVSAQTMLRLQNRVMTAAHEGLPVEPMVAKIQEGRTKGVPEPALEQACVRMENNLRTANQIMKHAVDEGFEPPRDQTQNRYMKTEMAQQMWRGTKEQDYDQLRDRARIRLRDGSCDVDDLVSAGELATRLCEVGVERQRALQLSGDALENGYRAREMRQLQLMVAGNQQGGGKMNQFMGDLEHCVGAGMGEGEMQNYMMRHGWMGPGDMYGPGGYDPADHKGHGGGGQDTGGDDGHGGHGGHGGSGGGSQ